MDNIFTALVCCLLALSFAMEQKGNLTTTTSLPGLNQTDTTPFNSTEQTATTSNMTTNSTTYSTTAPTESTTNYSTSLPTTIMTPSTAITSLTATTGSSHTTTLTAVTTAVIQTTDKHMSTSDTTVATSASSSPVSTTSDSNNKTTKAFLLDTSEKNMTIIFSSVLGVAALALVIFTFHKCKHKIQYAHQRLENDRGSFVADDDTLVISGGLYDGHPIYDNVPPVSTDQSQFRLEFLP
ncbi:uncharacterized protein V6R79_024942 [Siganus canaliculatus]